MLEFHASDTLNVVGSLILGDSLVTRARNELISQYFYAVDEHELDYLLWLDDDVYVPVGWLEEMAASGLDVVGCPYPLKTPISQEGVRCVVTGEVSPVSDYRAKVEYAGTGALMMSTGAVRALVGQCVDRNHVYVSPTYSRPLFDVFRVGGADGANYMSEDWYVCRNLGDLGFDVFVDSSSECRHDFAFRGPARLNEGRSALNGEDRVNWWVPLGP